MLDFENMNVATMQSLANWVLAVLAFTVAATIPVLIIAIRHTKRDARRHAEVLALLKEIRNRLDEQKSGGARE